MGTVQTRVRADVHLYAVNYETIGGEEWGFAAFAVRGEEGERHVSANRIKVARGDHDVRIEFQLVAHADLLLDWDPDEQIWVTEDARCPLASSSHNDIVSLGIGGDGKLAITDLNCREATLTYALVLRDSSGRRVLVDPVIENGGGGPC